jgi:hypothetical protein
MPEVEGHEKRLLLLSNSTLYGGGYLWLRARMTKPLSELRFSMTRSMPASRSVRFNSG